MHRDGWLRSQDITSTGALVTTESVYLLCAGHLSWHWKHLSGEEAKIPALWEQYEQLVYEGYQHKVYVPLA